jgi:hypothetical protein
LTWPASPFGKGTPRSLEWNNSVFGVSMCSRDRRTKGGQKA